MGLASNQVLGTFGAFKASFLLEEILINYLAETKLDQTRLSKLDQTRLSKLDHHCSSQAVLRPSPPRQPPLTLSSSPHPLWPKLGAGSQLWPHQDQHVLGVQRACC